MRGAERIIDVHVAQLRELFGERGIILLFFGMESEIFEQKHLPLLQISNHFLDFWAHTAGSKGDGLPQQFSKPGRNRPQAVLRFRLPFRPAQMRGEDEAPAFFEHVSNRWERCVDTGIVCNPAVRKRNIKVHAHKYTPAG